MVFLNNVRNSGEMPRVLIPAHYSQVAPSAVEVEPTAVATSSEGQLSRFSVGLATLVWLTELGQTILQQGLDQWQVKIRLTWLMMIWWNNSSFLPVFGSPLSFSRDLLPRRLLIDLLQQF